MLTRSLSLRNLVLCRFWARGTGYGTGDKAGSPVWDARASELAQKARDDEVREHHTRTCVLLHTIRVYIGTGQGRM